MTLSRTTKDHGEIRKWADSHGAFPAEVASTERRGERGILRFEFPHAPNRNDSNLKKISWEDFFQKFDENNLELVYQEKTADGQKSNFNKLVHPSSQEHSSHRSPAGSYGSAGSSQSNRSNKSESEGAPRSASSSSESKSHKSGSSTSQSAGSKSSTNMHAARDREIEDDLDIEDDIDRSSSRSRSGFKSR